MKGSDARGLARLAQDRRSRRSLLDQAVLEALQRGPTDLQGVRERLQYPSEGRTRSALRRLVAAGDVRAERRRRAERGGPERARTYYELFRGLMKPAGDPEEA